VVGSCDVPDIGDPTPLGQVYATDPAPGSIINKSAIVTLHYYGPPCNIIP
jgi:hypothetical protein